MKYYLPYVSILLFFGFSASAIPRYSFCHDSFGLGVFIGKNDHGQRITTVSEAGKELDVDKAKIDANTDINTDCYKFDRIYNVKTIRKNTEGASVFTAKVVILDRNVQVEMKRPKTYSAEDRAKAELKEDQEYKAVFTHDMICTGFEEAPTQIP